MPEVHNPLGSSSSGAVLSSTVALTAAQIRALNSVPVQLVAAPGAGRAIVVHDLALVLNFGTIRFGAAGTDDLQLLYQGFTPAIVSPNSAGFVEGTVSAIGVFTWPIAVPGIPLSDGNNKALMLTDALNYNAGAITSTTLAAGGLGYAIGDTGVIAAGNFDATYQVLTVDGAGAVLTYSITSPGTNYLPANGVTTNIGGAQPGAGAGFTVNITAVQNGDGTLKVTTFYSIIPVP